MKLMQFDLLNEYIDIQQGLSLVNNVFKCFKSKKLTKKEFGKLQVIVWIFKKLWLPRGKPNTLRLPLEFPSLYLTQRLVSDSLISRTVHIGWPKSKKLKNKINFNLKVINFNL